MEDRREVYSSRDAHHPMSWSVSAVDNHAVQITLGYNRGDLWEADEVYTLPDGDIITPEEYEENYFMCEIDGKIVHNDKAQTINYSEVASIDAIHSYNEADLVDQYVWSDSDNSWLLEPREGEIDVA